ncbi:hypothetical protein NBRC116590_02940 [Pelagimonas sp. KU-00592-HH]|uniref:hypothetical protein n=1 Tax=Pelagimonas sp. KU-00592-HH TaxID=3127651 RepID=UPI0031023521
MTEDWKGEHLISANRLSAYQRKRASGVDRAVARAKALSDRRDKVEALLKAGRTFAETAEILGMTADNVRKDAITRGIHNTKRRSENCCES